MDGITEATALAKAQCRQVVDALPLDCKDRCRLADSARAVGHLPAVRALGEKLGDLPEGQRAVLLHHDPSIWLLGWRKEDITTIHDHGDSPAVVAIVKGTITEELFTFKKGTDTRSGKPFEVYMSERDFHEGSLVSIPTPYIHRFTTPDEGCTVTVNIYSPRARRRRDGPSVAPKPQPLSAHSLGHDSSRPEGD